MPKFVIIGGGKGAVVQVLALKPDHWKDISVIVPMSDDGGSTGRIAQDQDVSPWGDARRALGGLAPANTTMAKLFEFRFSNGGSEGPSPWEPIRKALLAVAPAETRFAQLFGYVFPSLSSLEHFTRRMLGYGDKILSGKAVGNMILAALATIEDDPAQAVKRIAGLLDINPSYDEALVGMVHKGVNYLHHDPLDEALGNILLAALEKIEGSTDEAIRAAARLLDTRGGVFPCSLERLTMTALLENGKSIQTQTQVSHSTMHKSRIRQIVLHGLPEGELEYTDAEANPFAVSAIEQADYIFIGPGALHASILGSIAVPGIARALARAKARKIYFLNIAIRWQETHGFGPEDHVRAILAHSPGMKLHLVVVNEGRVQVPEGIELLEWEKDKILDILVLHANLIDTCDVQNESYYLHDSEKIRAILPQILERSAQ